MTEELKEIKIYTDGACSGNPGPGGYASLLIHDKHRKELSGGFRKTTNNRMEIIAAIKGLEALKYPCKVKLYSDSKYLVNAMVKGWAARWKSNFWMRNKKEAAQNPDLWKRLLKLCDTHETTFIWVKGHAYNKNNNRCDELAVAASQKSNLPPDEGYENNKAPSSLQLFPM